MSKRFATNPGTMRPSKDPKYDRLPTLASSAPSKSVARRRAAMGPATIPAAAPTVAENKSAAPEENACIGDPAAIIYASENAPAATPAQLPESPVRSPKTMKFTHVPNARKNPDTIIFKFADGRAGTVQFQRSAFPADADGGIPTEIDIDGSFAAPKQPKAKMTAEERKAARANAPKPTLAEKVAKAEARAAKLRAKLATAPAAESEAAVGM